MSLRRVDDDGDASAPLSIGAAIDALADRLPVATRLNHVLAIGAKFKLEQLGKPPPPPQQQHKPVSTDAYRRATSGRWGRLYENCAYEPNQAFKNDLNAYKNAIIMLANNPANVEVQKNAVRATAALQTRVMANNTPRLKAIDYLRQEDCYIALNYMANNLQTGTESQKWAQFMMRESLHHDKTSVPQTIHNMADGQCRMSRMLLQAYGGPNFNYTEANYPPIYNVEKEQHDMLEKMCAKAVDRADADEINQDRALQAPGLHNVERQMERMRNRDPAGPSFLNGADEYLPTVNSLSGHRGPDRNPRV